MKLHKDPKTGLIRSLPLFADLRGRDVNHVAAVADEVVLAAGKVMATENADGHEFVVIADGTAQVVRAGSVIAELETGDFFGETALMLGRPRNADVVAVTEVTALVIEGHAFLRLLEEVPAVRAKVEEALVERLPAAS